MIKPHKGMLQIAALMFVAMIAILTMGAIFLPVWLKSYLSFLYEHRHFNYLALMWILFFASAQAITMLILALQIILSVSKEKSFVMGNYHRLRIISYLSFGIMALFIACMFVYLTPYTVVFIGGTAVLGIIVMIISNLLKQAIEIQEENDYTV